MLSERQKVFFWGAYTRGGGGLIFGWAYIRVEKRVTNLGALYSEELIHGEGGDLFTEFYGIFCGKYQSPRKLQNKKPLKRLASYISLS